MSSAHRLYRPDNDGAANEPALDLLDTGVNVDVDPTVAFIEVSDVDGVLIALDIDANASQQLRNAKWNGTRAIGNVVLPSGYASFEVIRRHLRALGLLARLSAVVPHLFRARPVRLCRCGGFGFRARHNQRASSEADNWWAPPVENSCGDAVARTMLWRVSFGMGGAATIGRSQDVLVGVADRATRFRSFCLDVEPRLRRALVAAYGPDLGSEAAAESLSWAWEHFERVEAMKNPAGYLWRVGQSSTRRELGLRRRRSDEVATDPSSSSVDYEPRLSAAVDGLSQRQRVAVLLVHGHGYSLAEAAEQMGCGIRTLRNHLERGMTKLRQDLGVDDDD